MKHHVLSESSLRKLIKEARKQLGGESRYIVIKKIDLKGNHKLRVKKGSLPLNES